MDQHPESILRNITPTMMPNKENKQRCQLTKNIKLVWNLFPHSICSYQTSMSSLKLFNWRIPNLCMQCSLWMRLSFIMVALFWLADWDPWFTNMPQTQALYHWNKFSFLDLVIFIGPSSNESPLSSPTYVWVGTS